MSNMCFFNDEFGILDNPKRFKRFKFFKEHMPRCFLSLDVEILDSGT